MVRITKEKWIKNSVEVIVFNGIKWLNEKHIERQLGHANLVAITQGYPEYKKHRCELVDDEPEKQSNRIFLYGGIVKIIMDCRTVETCNFKRRLGFYLFDVISTKAQTVIESIKDAFEGENMQTEYYQSECRIDLYFHDLGLQ